MNRSSEGCAHRLVALSALVLMVIMVCPAAVSAQQNMEDVVYLRNGSIIRGTIIEQVPNVSIKIQTRDGNVFVYQMAEIERIAKEPVQRGGVVVAPMGDRTYLFNPLGFIQFGPIFEMEMALSDNLYAVPHIRFASLGLLMHVLADYDQLSMSTMAVGFGVRGFFPVTDSPNMVYAGGGVEYGWGGGWDDPGESYETEYKFTYVSFLGNIGYRWRYPSKFFLNVGLIAGAALELSDVMVSPGDTTYSNDVFIFGMFEVSFGKER